MSEFDVIEQDHKKIAHTIKNESSTVAFEC